MRRIAVLILTAVFLAGCGVPVQQRPVPIDPEAIPSRLSGTESPTSGPATATPGKPTIQVNFVRNDRLVTVVRDAAQTPAPDRLDSVVQALMAGPNDSEQAAGLSSALPPDLALKVADVQGTHVVLDLSGQTDGRSATENVLAVGQIVLSVTALPTVDEVSFQRDGVAVEALLADGALTTQPLTAANYESLRSR